VKRSNCISTAPRCACRFRLASSVACPEERITTRCRRQHHFQCARAQFQHATAEPALYNIFADDMTIIVAGQIEVRPGSGNASGGSEMAMARTGDHRVRGFVVAADPRRASRQRRVALS
jgi:hypothetical protein